MRNSAICAINSCVHFSETDIRQIDVRNQNGTSQCVKSAAGVRRRQLVIQRGRDKARSTAQSLPVRCGAGRWRGRRRFTTSRRRLSQSKLAKPPVHVTLTNGSGKKMEIEVSAPPVSSVYARTSAGPEVYKLEKQIFDDLNAKTASEATANTPAPANAHP